LIALVGLQKDQFFGRHSRLFLTGCPQAESREAAECLRKLPAESFLPDMEKPCTFVPHMPTIDGVFIPDEPEKLVKSGRYNKDIDVMLGTMSNEGYLLGHCDSEQ
jgi:carboxylesterase type B